MSKRVIKLRVQNGITFEDFKKEVFDIDRLTDLYDIQESENPDFIVFGPYGNDVPAKGNYVRIGYFCENVKPDLSVCEWAFGIPAERDVNDPKYKRIQWHGLDPQLLVRAPDYNPKTVAASKTKFCNFLYSHKVPYREGFFKHLSRYKRVDAPGKSMNNMPGIDSLYQGGKWDVKKQFLSPYKFTLAFENDIYPGYQTEKLYDAMLTGSIPIYCGDPNIGDVFNTKSFINVADHLPFNNKFLSEYLGKIGLMDFEDIRPRYLNSPKSRIKRKIKALIRDYKIKYQFAGIDFSPVIEHIIAVDNEPDLYLKYLNEPWFKNNQIPENSSARTRWIEIFESKE